ncbi:MAG: hypothetical protein HPY50_03000 [Firmicutes bacterium]|nr:hypothetical protein [Bacillota bacterium]
MKARKTYGIIRNKWGTSFPLTVAVTLVLAILLCGASEYMRLMIIASGVRDAVQSAIISTVNDNYDDVYHGVREGYAGGYQPVGGSSWEDSLDYGDIYAYLDNTLGLQKSGGYHVKYAGEAVEFRLSGLSVDIRNAPLAPSDPAGTQGFLADATIRLEVPVSFAGKILPPMRINPRVQARYMPLF